METYRLFVAAELSPAVKAELAAVQNRLRRVAPPVTWAAPAGMHLTLRFLGETDAARVPELGARLAEAIADYAAFALRLGAAGAFPNERRPSVLWVGVEGELTQLASTQRAVEAAMVDVGFAPEQRAFRPHLTLGRVRRDASAEQQRQLSEALRALPAPAPVAWAVEGIALFRSELRGEGPTYTRLVDLRL